MFNWSKQWWGYIAGHAALGVFFTELVTFGSPSEYQSFAVPIFFLFFMELKENYGKRKAIGLPTGVWRTFWSVLKQESATQKQRSEWLLAGLISAGIMYLIHNVVL